MKNAYLGQVVLMLAIFLLTGKSLHEAFSFRIIPGDSYTYEASLYDVLDRAHEHYWRTTLDMFTGGSPHLASLTPILVSVLSPFLIKETSSLVLVNFVAILGAILCLRLLLSEAGIDRSIAATVTMLVWLLPFSYTQQVDTTSLLSMMPDPIFLWTICGAAIVTALFVSFPERRGLALGAGVFSGVALWARGNSFSYVGLLVGCAVAISGVRLVSGDRDARRIVNQTLWLGTIVAVGGFFYVYHYARISDYYYGWIYSANVNAYSLEKALVGAKWILNNIPGVFFTHTRDTVLARLISYGFDVYFVWLLWHAAVQRRHAAGPPEVAVRYALLLAAVYYLAGLLLGCVSLGSIYSAPSFRVLGPFAPILVGIVMSLAILVALAISHAGWMTDRVARYAPVIVALVVAVYAAALTRTYMLTPGIVEDKDVGLYAIDYQAFSLKFSEITRGRPVAFLWYGDLSSMGVSYYQAKLVRFDPRKKSAVINSVNLRNLYRTSLDPTQVASAAEFQAMVQAVLSEADFILIPEDLNDYKLPTNFEEAKVRQRDPGLFATYYMVLAEMLNDPSGPTFAVRAVVNGPSRHRILLIEKLYGPPGVDSTVFPKTWGTPQQVLHRAFAGVPQFGYRAPEIGDEPRFEPYNQLRDNSFESFVEFTTKARTITLVLSAPVRIDSYRISSGKHLPESLDRAPVHWQVLGSVDGREWTLIDDRQVMEPWKDSETKSFRVDHVGTYRRLKVTFLEAQASACCRLYELHFTDNGRDLDTLFSPSMALSE
jgi:hypothetical protein